MMQMNLLRKNKKNNTVISFNVTVAKVTFQSESEELCWFELVIHKKSMKPTKYTENKINCITIQTIHFYRR